MKNGNRFGRSAMSRKTFAKGIGLAAAGVGAAALGLGGIARSQAPDPCNGIGSMDLDGYYEVNGLDTFPDDIERVQCAVNNYPKVRLVGTFYFGESESGGSVFIAGDTELIGKLDNAGNKLATIKGGDPSFYLLNEGEAIITISVKDLKFIKSGRALASDGLIQTYIISCDIFDYMPYFEPNLGFYVAFGILSHQAGFLSVRNCYIKAHDDCRFAISENGIQYSGVDLLFGIPGGADVEVIGNTVITSYADSSLAGFYPDWFMPAHTGIAVVEFYPEWTGHFTKAVITGNTITSESGINCWGLNNSSVISGNTMNGVKYVGIRTTFNPLLDAPIYLDNASISNNKITMAGNLPQFGLSSYAIYLAGSYNYIQGNNISGTSDFGSYVLSGSSGNRFIGNNEARLAKVPESNEFWLYYFEEDACGNVVKGYTGGANTKVFNWQCNDVSGVK